MGTEERKDKRIRVVVHKSRIKAVCRNPPTATLRECEIVVLSWPTLIQWRTIFSLLHILVWDWVM